MSLATFSKSHFTRRFLAASRALLPWCFLPCMLEAQVGGWVQQFGTSDDDQVRAIAVDGSGAYVSGWTVGELPGQEKSGRQNSFIRKYDTAGNEVWTRQFGVGNHSAGLSLAVSASGIYVGGSSRDDVFIRKYDADGKDLWTDRFGTVSDANEEVRGIAADDTGVYLAGSTADTLPEQTSAGNADAFVRRYDAEGKEVWTRQFGTSDFDQVRGIAISSSGLYVAGMTTGVLPGQTGAGAHDVFVRKYDPDGNEVWTRQFGTSSLDDGCGVAVDDSGVYVLGSTTGVLSGQTGAGAADTFVRKYDLDGNELWTRQFGTAQYDQARAIAVHPSGVFVSAWTLGALPGQTNQGLHDAFVVQYSLAGEQIWAHQFGSANLDDPLGISVDALGIYVGGLTGGTFQGQENAGNVDAFVAKLDRATHSASTLDPSGVQTTADGR